MLTPTSPEHFTNFRYRPEVDGLRAVAVVMVVLFHAGLGFPGGYIGVDVFFVISGYLITSLIWKDLEKGEFTMANFWERRARRIIPALLVVTFATLAAGWVVLLPGDFKSLGRATASQVVFAANIHYWLDSGYFSTTADEKPLLHTWSLAVEEQFYLIAPLALWGLHRLGFFRRRAAVIAVLGLGFVVSLAMSLYGVKHHPSATFYLLPTRAWELLLGSIVAFLPFPAFLLYQRRVREAVSLIGLALIGVPALIYTKETPFPGFAALPPCAGAAFVIWANGFVNGDALTSTGALLALRPVVFVGLISYSLYLWHWPFLAYARYLTPIPLSMPQISMMLTLGVIFSILSWRFVETPFRTRQLGSSRRSMFLITGTGLSVLFGLGTTLIGMNGFPQRFPPQTREFATARTDSRFEIQLNVDDIREDRLVPFGNKDSAVIPRVVVWGDSHAMAALPAFDSLLQELGIAGRAAIHSDTPPLLNWQSGTRYSLGDNSIPFNHAVLENLERHQIQDVFLVAYWSRYRQPDGRYSESFVRSLLETIRRITKAGARSWLVLDVPTHTFDIPKALTSFTVSREQIVSLATKPTTDNFHDGIDAEVIANVESLGGRILDPKPRFLDPTGKYYVIDSQGIALYRDNNHLTTKGAKAFLTPLIREALTPGR